MFHYTKRYSKVKQCKYMHTCKYVSVDKYFDHFIGTFV